MSRDTHLRRFNAKRLSENVQALLTAKVRAASATAAQPDSPGGMVEWLTVDLDRNTEMALTIYGEMAVISPFTEERVTTYQPFSTPSPHEPTDWKAISREVAQLRQADSLIPNGQTLELARRVAARDYSRDDIQQWAKSLSQLPFSDEE